jgi:hypothetical protein
MLQYLLHELVQGVLNALLLSYKGWIQGATSVGNMPTFGDLVNKVVVQSPWKVDACQCLWQRGLSFSCKN